MTDLEPIARACYETWAKRMDLLHPLSETTWDGHGPRWKARTRWELLSSSMQDCWRQVATAALREATEHA